MSFIPPRCPYPTCDQHVSPRPRFWRRRGCYHPRCRTEPVPRFRCSSCGRSFSRQTFRHDYRDRRPECNELLFVMLISGVSLRQCGRNLSLSARAVQLKMRKLSRTCELLHDNLAPRLPSGRTYLMDEEETFEGASIRPLTMPVLIEKETWFVVATAAGRIRRLAAAGTARRRRQERDELARGRRPDESNKSVREVLGRLAERISGPIELHTDQKPSYPSIARRIFGDRLTHETTSGKQIRATFNRLFAINTTLAMTRDNCSRLRRNSWHVTRVTRRLRDQMALFTVFRNYVRRRFRRDPRSRTAASLLRLLPRNLLPLEALRWRQDGGRRSPHPLSSTGARCYASDSLQAA